MSTAYTESPSVLRNSSRRQPSYNTPPSNDRPQRAASSASKPPTTPIQPTRATSQTYARPPAASQQVALAGVAQRDQETTNLARPPSSHRSSSREQTAATPRRNESTRESRHTSSRPSHSRNTSRISAATTAVASETPVPMQAPRAAQTQNDPGIPPGSGGSAKRRTTIDATTGQWSLGKTIGAGSMGKVKLAKNLETGEQCAIKIVPRLSTDEHRSQRDQERADHSKEIRTAREAAIVTLLNHPYVCAMRDVVRSNYHWYMLFEYVNGGQMLDYIISHGRLKEKQARKFGRQIASALDYCHRNSIVHRDLKIENILISKTGDIKIIDFGLSNLFSPRSHLKTFCGSLYFAAPELLQAKQYTGPEVDIWSFGIVLYVLVCGKVPFDDQSMPQLHAKIKKGVVDYPAWLSPECKNLISKMLVTDPKQRASLSEIMNHPWMTKGFNSPPENYMLHREPLQLPLDPQIVDKMTGFDFGKADYITKELTRVLTSEEYQIAVKNIIREQAAHAMNNEKKRGVFDFYKRRSSVTSRDTLPNSSSEAVLLGSDPINAFSPLISIYFLVREKQERERKEVNPGALSMPMSPGEKPLQMPDLPAPEAAYTNASAYEMPGEKATGGRSRARSRTHGEDDVIDGMRKVNLNISSDTTTPNIMIPSSHGQQPKKESATVGLLRRFSTRRTREPRSQSSQTPSLQLPSQSGSTSEAAPSPRKSFSVRRSRNRDPTPTPLLHPGGSTPHQAELLTATGSLETRPKTSNALDRSASVNSADYRKRQSRRGVSEGQAAVGLSEPPLTSGSEQSSMSGHKPKANEPAPLDQKSSLNARAATMRTKSLGHAARRDSMQGRRDKRQEAYDNREANVPEERDQDLVAGPDNPNKSLENMKPVYLKGLFSVSTTSNKPLPVIRMDIVRVLNQLGVEYGEIKGGFSCRHAPSIDLSRMNDNGPASSDFQPNHRRRISFAGGLRSNNDERSEKPNITSIRRGQPAADTSYTASDESDNSEHAVRSRPSGAGERVAGETTTHVQSDLGESMVLKFEIFIVKVPLFSLHGIQFKKVSGGTWNYKEMAQRILDALRL